MNTKAILFFSSYLLATHAWATSVNVPTLDEAIEQAELVATIELLSVRELRPDSQSTVICGFEYSARITKTFKGEGETVRFISRTRADVIESHSRYLIIAFRLDPDANYLGRTGLAGCDNVTSTRIYVTDFLQSLFPIDADLYTTESVLISRRSVFTPFDAIPQEGPIRSFIIVGDRIYAAADWTHLRGLIINVIGD